MEGKKGGEEEESRGENVGGDEGWGGAMGATG